MKWAPRKCTTVQPAMIIVETKLGLAGEVIQNSKKARYLGIEAF